MLFGGLCLDYSMSRSERCFEMLLSSKLNSFLNLTAIWIWREKVFKLTFMLNPPVWMSQSHVPTGQSTLTSSLEIDVDEEETTSEGSDGHSVSSLNSLDSPRKVKRITKVRKKKDPSTPGKEEPKPLPKVWNSSINLSSILQISDKVVPRTGLTPRVPSIDSPRLKTPRDAKRGKTRLSTKERLKKVRSTHDDHSRLSSRMISMKPLTQFE